MDAQDAKAATRNGCATQVLRRLDDLGAVKLDVLVAKASEIQNIAGLEDDDHGIFYPFYIRIGPRGDLDLVSVATQLRELGFDLKRVGPQVKG